MVNQRGGNSHNGRKLGRRVAIRLVRGRTRRTSQRLEPLWGSALETHPIAPSHSRSQNPLRVRTQAGEVWQMEQTDSSAANPSSTSSQSDQPRQLARSNQQDLRVPDRSHIDAASADDKQGLKRKYSSNRNNNSNKIHLINSNPPTPSIDNSRPSSSRVRNSKPPSSSLPKLSNSGGLKSKPPAADPSQLNLGGLDRRNFAQRGTGKRANSRGRQLRPARGQQQQWPYWPSNWKAAQQLGNWKAAQQLSNWKDAYRQSNWKEHRETYLQTKTRFKNVVALPRMGYERIALRIQQGTLRLKLGLLLIAAFLAVVGMPALAGLALNKGQRLPVLAMMTTTDAQDSILVYRWNTRQVVQVPLSEYLVNVLAAEMSPKAPFAALQAAAIAARTYAVRSTQRQLFSTPTFAQSHGADVTDNGVLDLPWLTAAQQQARFGAQANADTVRYQEAVASTDGEILTYQGQPILAFSFALSPGVTRSGSTVFGVPLPYLTSVACPADMKNPKVKQVFRISAQTVAQELGLSGKFTPTALTVSGRDKAGFVNTVSYHGSAGTTASRASATGGAKSWSGPQFAALLHLPSSNFTFVTTGVSGGSAGQGGQPMLVIETKGIGLDLGMSLNEAAAMAAQGKQAAQILSYFYPGTALASDSKWAQSLKST